MNDQISYLSTSSELQLDFAGAVHSDQRSVFGLFHLRDGYAEVLGLLSSTQVMYTRTLPNLALGPIRHTGYGQRSSFPITAFISRISGT